jgi:hypothetical protein
MLQGARKLAKAGRIKIKNLTETAKRKNIFLSQEANAPG